MNDSLVTILGSSYFEPISALLEKLEKHESNISNQVQSGYYEKGFAASICILSVVCLESYVMRVRYINSANQDHIDRTPVVSYLKSLYPDFPFENELLELHILRDLLAHNHLWEISYSFNEDDEMEISEVEKRSSGDKKYRQRVDTENHVTKTLGLNVNPIKVGASDVKLVLQTMWKILLFLESKNRNQCYVSHLRAVYKGTLRQFGEIIGMPETCT
ncbi:hypothetical protein [Methylomarinum vadi]|uniref:hypothetical protein n=1 Tax=Methylomarinum vadi TaxID=438855 RepID=UPI0004DFBDD5|nr:hypothetical protein [Methylomarinum vadi]